jgi:hypothetical protein
MKTDDLRENHDLRVFSESGITSVVDSLELRIICKSGESWGIIQLVVVHHGKFLKIVLATTGMGPCLAPAPRDVQ